jgi:hypothetical protein
VIKQVAEQGYGWKAIQHELVRLYGERVTKHLGTS